MTNPLIADLQRKMNEVFCAQCGELISPLFCSGVCQEKYNDKDQHNNRSELPCVDETYYATQDMSSSDSDVTISSDSDISEDEPENCVLCGEELHHPIFCCAGCAEQYGEFVTDSTYIPIDTEEEDSSDEDDLKPIKDELNY